MIKKKNTNIIEKNYSTKNKKQKKNQKSKIKNQKKEKNLSIYIFFFIQKQQLKTFSPFFFSSLN
jgi:hypothetical protein